MTQGPCKLLLLVLMQVTQAINPRMLTIPENQTSPAIAAEDNISINNFKDSTRRRDTLLVLGGANRQPSLETRSPKQQTNLLTKDFANTDPVYSLFKVSHRTAKPLHVAVQLPLSMEVDTGCDQQRHVSESV